MIKKENINQNNFIGFGEMNLILQITGSVNQPEDEFEVLADQYQPRKSSVWSGDFTDKASFISNVKDTIERFKIGQQLLQDWLDGKNEHVYYYDLHQLQE